jgi:hypothetical protein
MAFWFLSDTRWSTWIFDFVVRDQGIKTSENGVGDVRSRVTHPATTVPVIR